MTQSHLPASTFRRRFVSAIGLSSLAAALPMPAGSAAPRTTARGIEGQRIADQGDGTFQNPILAGDHPDPTILKDGDDYYLTCSSFEAYPGLLIWHSRDLGRFHDRPSRRAVAFLRSGTGREFAHCASHCCQHRHAASGRSWYRAVYVLAAALRGRRSVL